VRDSKATTPAHGRRLLGSQPMILASSEAFTKTFGLAATFIGIQVVVIVIVIYIAVQIRGERAQNREYLASRKAPPGS